MESWNLTGTVTKTSKRFRPAYLRTVNALRDVRLIQVGGSEEDKPALRVASVMNV